MKRTAIFAYDFLFVNRAKGFTDLIVVHSSEIWSSETDISKVQICNVDEFSIWNNDCRIG